ncbi:transposable element Tc3 transposase [Clonorchis sinensis]|uniref:Transposable element Tc3 transposase n=1 Tax=Clonorchis sinensis TaxID=79923 RepID=G7Y7Y8_CLOSI|nr:transposable element Tc3 transposase [Clonorchis sinensis]
MTENKWIVNDTYVLPDGFSDENAAKHYIAAEHDPCRPHLRRQLIHNESHYWIMLGHHFLEQVEKFMHRSEPFALHERMHNWTLDSHTVRHQEDFRSFASTEGISSATIKSNYAAPTQQSRSMFQVVVVYILSGENLADFSGHKLPHFTRRHSVFQNGPAAIRKWRVFIVQHPHIQAQTTGQKHRTDIAVLTAESSVHQQLDICKPSSHHRKLLLLFSSNGRRRSSGNFVIAPVLRILKHGRLKARLSQTVTLLKTRLLLGVFVDHRMTSGDNHGPQRGLVLDYEQAQLDRQSFLCVITLGSQTGRKSLSDERASIVQNAVEQFQSQSTMASSLITQVSQLTGILRASVHRIMRRHLHLCQYYFTLLQNITEEDKEQRVTFANWLLDNEEIVPNILWSDEANFSVDGIINKHNCVIWSREAPHEYLTHNLYSPHLCVWMGFSSKCLLRPFFFDATVSGDSYLHMLRTHVIPQLKQHKRSSTVFQQDGAPPHYSNQVRAYLREQFFDERVIARGFPNFWPARSPDLTPLDYWYWGMIKTRVYHEHKPKNLVELRARIEEECARVPLNEVKHAVSHFLYTKPP